MGIVGNLMEVIIFVEEMEKMVEFYRDTMELSVVFPTDVDDFSDQDWVVFDTGACSLCLHSGGSHWDDPEPDLPKFVFEVDDLTEAQTELLTRGVPMGKTRSPAPGIEVCDGYDPERNKFSIESHSS